MVTENAVFGLKIDVSGVWHPRRLETRVDYRGSSQCTHSFELLGELCIKYIAESLRNQDAVLEYIAYMPLIFLSLISVCTYQYAELGHIPSYVF